MAPEQLRTSNGWLARPDADDRLLAAVAASRPDSAGVHLVKDNPVRMAYRLAPDGAGTPVFVKRYKCRGFSDRFKYRLVASKARSEWDRLRLFAARGLPVPQPLAMREVRRRGALVDSQLVMEYLPDAPPLIERYHDSPTAEGRRLLRQAAGLVHRVHAARVFYRDLHAGNVLVRQVPGGSELILIDLHRAWVLPWLPGAARVRDIAQFCNSLELSAADQLLFLEHYCSRPDTPRMHRLMELVSARRARLAAVRVCSRSKRCVKNSSVYEIARDLRSRYCGRRDFGRARAERLIAEHERTRSHDPVKRASKSVLTRHAQPGGEPICVKGYGFNGWRYSLRTMPWRSRAMRSWRAASGLLVRGIDTPLPLALLERRVGPLVTEAFFLCRWLEDYQELNDYVRGRDWTCAERRAFARTFARYVRTMHRRGIYHADMKSDNIMVRRHDRGWAFALVDLDRVYFHKRLTFRRRVNNLAQINASVAAVMSATDRMVFFHTYAADSAIFARRKRWLRAVLAICRTKLTDPYGVWFRSAS